MESKELVTLKTVYLRKYMVLEKGITSICTAAMTISEERLLDIAPEEEGARGDERCQ